MLPTRFEQRQSCILMYFLPAYLPAYTHPGANVYTDVFHVHISQAHVWASSSGADEQTNRNLMDLTSNRTLARQLYLSCFGFTLAQLWNTIYGFCLSYFSCCYGKINSYKQLKAGNIYFSSWLHCGREVRIAGTRSGWPNCSHSQEEEPWMLASAELSFSILLQKHLCREWSHPQLRWVFLNQLTNQDNPCSQAQRPVSQVTVDSIKLTINTIQHFSIKI